MSKLYIPVCYCPKCDKYFKSLDAGIHNPPCPDCDTPCERKLVEKGSEQDPSIRYDPVTIGYKENIRYSVTLGVSDKDLAAARKLHPQAEWKKFGNSWRPRICNRAEKKKMMKQAGMVEFPPDYFETQEGKRR